MALLQYRAPVDYKAQQEAFRDFLQSFKSSESTSETAAAAAIDDLRIDGDTDGISNDYDLMDDVETEIRATGQEQGSKSQSKFKYMAILQEVANREKSEIVIELDDLDLVGIRFTWRKERNLADLPFHTSMNDHCRMSAR